MDFFVKELFRRFEGVMHEMLRESPLMYYFTETITGYGVLVFDQRGLIYHANKKYCEMHGYEIGELDGLTIYEKILLPEERDYWRDFLHKIGNESYNPDAIHINTLHKTGRIIRKELFLNIIYSSKGADTFFTVSRDITHEVDDVLLYKFYEGVYHAIFNVTEDAMVVMFYDTGSFIDINRKAIEMYGYSRDEIAFLTYKEISAEPEKAAESLSQRDRHISGRHHRRKNGEVFPVDITCEYIIIQDRELVFIKVKDLSEEAAEGQLFSRITKTLDVVSDVVLQVNPETEVVTKANLLGKQIFGVNVIGKTLSGLLDNKRISIVIRRSHKTKKTVSVNTYINLLGVIKYLSIRTMPVMDQRGDVISIEVIMADRTADSLLLVTKSGELSRRERTILFLLMEGVARREIAQTLKIVPQAVDTTKRRIEKKIGMTIDEYIARMKRK